MYIIHGYNVVVSPLIQDYELILKHADQELSFIQLYSNRLANRISEMIEEEKKSKGITKLSDKSLNLYREYSKYSFDQVIAAYNNIEDRSYNIWMEGIAITEPKEKSKYKVITNTEYPDSTKEHIEYIFNASLNEMIKSNNKQLYNINQEIIITSLTVWIKDLPITFIGPDFYNDYDDDY